MNFSLKKQCPWAMVICFVFYFISESGRSVPVYKTAETPATQAPPWPN